ncbi:MAG: diaminopimelate epimerase [Ilumatobacter sp.]|uniref:diaminopimelate epimerase n=1 Tax=Ilumatobacter sp. TaxID=1967498 RepID=UPI00329A76CD
MTALTLTKHHGLGNDFLVVFHPGQQGVTDLPAFARRLCDRRTGIGADGLLVADTEDGYAARMTLYNGDGSTAEMSGNGIRCFAQAVAARRGDLGPQLILTDAGEKVVTLSATDDPATIMAQVEMGPVEPLAEPSGWAAVECHPDRPVAHLSLGNPHSVVGVDEVAMVDLHDLGGRIPHVNLEIVEPGPESNAITMRVHERGAGITAACGTGACASAFAARSWGLVPPIEPEVIVHMDGGDAVVTFDESTPPRAILTGPATHIATIEVEHA